MWSYQDGHLVADWPDRPCGHCGLANTPEGHDACLGALRGVMNACCGHGEEAMAYIQFDDGQRLEGIQALLWACLLPHNQATINHS